MTSRLVALALVLGGAGLALAAASLSGAAAGQALALAAAAGGLLLLVLGRVARRILGGLLVLLAGGMITVAVVGRDGAVILVLAALLVGVGAVLIMITGPRWPTRSASYQRVRRIEDESAWWQAMNAGIDPTLDAKRADPDVHIPAPPDTMGIADQSQQSSRRE